MNTQTDLIIDYLKQGNALTPLEALQRFGCFRLGARIWDARRAGHRIESRIIRTAGGKNVAEYRLTKE